MVYKNANGTTHSKRMIKKVSPEYGKHSTARPYIRHAIKKNTVTEIKNYYLSA